MCNTATNGILEAYKSVIDFNKTIISISSTILAALIGYLVYQKIEFRLLNYISLALLVISIALSIAGFGQAIKTVKDATSRRGTIAFTNFGAIFLLVGVLAILLIRNDEKTIDDILKTVENSTTAFDKKLSSKNCISIQLQQENYILHYKIDTTNAEVIYSTDKKNIISIK